MTHLSLKEIALALEVSVETVRNWQRMEVLERYICEADIVNIKCRLTAQGRLMSRANKLQNETTAHLNREGIYYTPQWIIRDMLSSIPKEDIANKTLLDPCCGSGNFLDEAVAIGFQPKNIYGFDTDSNAVAHAKGRVKGAHIECGDFLEIAPKLKRRFDYIYTNPPWGKRLSMESRALCAQCYSTPRSADSSALFMVASLSLLREGGKLGFLVQEAVFNVGAYEWLRQRLLKLKVVSLSDYSRPFRGLMTRAQGVIIENREALIGDVCECRYASQSHTREISSFADNPKSIMNFWATQQDMLTIKKIYSMPHRTLKGAARWGLGIVTGDNRRHCQMERSEEFSVGVITGADIYKRELLAPTLFINGELSRYQQAAAKEIYEAEEKLIYRFISRKLIFRVDRGQHYLLNSANCLVVDRDFGVSGEQIAQLLSSEVVNWMYEKLFRSPKILRSDIEVLPLHTEYFQGVEEFDEQGYREWLGVTGRYLAK